MISRRHFLRSSGISGLALSLAGPVPGLFARAAALGDRNAGERILVVLQLTGGNDGTNTLVPYGDDLYRKNRFTLGLPEIEIIRIDDYVGLHPSLGSFDSLMAKRRMTFLQGVGYPNPNRSHFESMDLIHTAHQYDSARSLGWLGRASDKMTTGQSLPPIHIGNEEQPLALSAATSPATTIRSTDLFRLKVLENGRVRPAELQRLVQTDNPDGPANPLIEEVRRSAEMGMKTGQQLSDLRLSSNRRTVWPGSGLARRMKQVADLIAAEIPVRIFYLTLDGFDTHANQLEAHASLLREWSEALSAFIADMEQQGNADRVLVYSFSEFGRRLRENASRGTDHGAASVAHLAGPEFCSVLTGKYPSLKELDNEGDLVHTLDYRTVYATILEQWLGIEDAGELLNGSFGTIKLFS